ncbi:MAG: di-trans,poly-cis-decaprenylcistransferase, partial [Opitutales bacterium]|nr:di-trans,poly-cis-decaprenylcistransferase [Opitutales bacterium]
YAFSSENWNRPKSEVSALMKLLVKTIKKYSGEFEKNEIRFRTIGDISKLPDECIEALEELKKRTQNFTKANLVLALNYGSRDELLRAISKLGQKKISAPTWEDVAANLDTAGIPDPDFLIRTSGEMRLSNYLLLQAAYAELYFTDVLWPDFNEAEFQKALDKYAKRERRYGLTTEQLKNND